jgi:replicative DNA helicase
MVLMFNESSQDLKFTTNVDALPPCNIEIEEAIIGGILLDPEAIYRIKDRLRPEHFYINAHRDIYKACLKLANKNRPTDLLSVTAFLTENDILTRIGGRNKLATVVDRTVSAVNIDALALEVIKSALRREIIKTGNEIIEASYQTRLEIDEVLETIKNKVEPLLNTPLAATREENQRFRHDRLVKELTEIYTTCDEPSLRYLKLKELADESRLSLGFLENFYLKSLTAQCGKLLSLKELQELAGSTVREWLLNGLVPKHSTILLASDGGVGKTKFVYGVGKTLIRGNEFGTFHTTGQKRKILYYQGDESPGDMWQALQQLGYSEEDEDKFVKIRFGWSSENMPTLIKDLNEFKPDLVVIDSLSTINRFSSYQESQLEYARPVLEMTGLAIQHKCTFLIIHHTSRKGDIRGTTAIRNAVSEVWTLSKPTDGQSTPSDRILEINKSRSRSSGKKYRLYFNEDLTFDFLGDEAEEIGGAAATNKDKLLGHLSQNRNTRFTSRELGHILNINDDSARRALSQLSGDGLVSCHKVKGKPNLYFLSYEGEQPDQAGGGFVVLGNPTFSNCKESLQVIRGQTHDHPVITPDDHPETIDLSMVSAKGDQVITQNSNFENSEPEKFSEQITYFDDHLSSEALPDNDSKVIIQGDHQGDHGVITSQDDQHGSTELVHPQKTIPTTGDFVYLPSGKIERIKARVGGGATFEESGEYIDLELLDIADFESNLELLRQCISDKDYGQVDELTSQWCESYKVEMRTRLTPQEKGILTKLRNQRKTNEKPENRLLVIREGGAYWIKPMNQVGVVDFVIDTTSTVSVLISKPKGSFTFSFDDLEALPESPTVEINVGDKVEVVEGKYRGTSGFKVSSIQGNKIYLKGSGTKIKLGYSFYAHQLKVVSP